MEMLKLTNQWQFNDRVTVTCRFLPRPCEGRSICLSPRCHRDEKHHHSSHNQHSSRVMTNAGENPFTPKHTAFYPCHLLGILYEMQLPRPSPASTKSSSHLTNKGDFVSPILALCYKKFWEELMTPTLL